MINEIIQGVLVAGLVALGGWFIPYFRRKELRDRRFEADWNGEEERPGVPRKPGVMERLYGLEEGSKIIKRELQANGGGSMKDAMNDLRSRVNKVESKCDSCPGKD